MANPYVVQQQNQQQQMPMIKPMQFMQGNFGGLTGLGGDSVAAGGESSGGSGSGLGSLMDSPVGIAATPIIGQSVMDKHGISTWGDALRGQSDSESGYWDADKVVLDKDSALYDVAGGLGWRSSGDMFNPSYIPTKIFGKG
jgi:hypothetical protein